jgi:hypothetical protein
VNLYAIKVVPPDWTDTMPLPFDKAQHDKAKLEQGTRVLIYRDGEGIVGEGEIAGFAVEPARWVSASLEHLPPSLAQAEILQPVKLLYSRENALTQQEVRHALEQPQFPQGADWLSLDRDQYARLANWPS